MFNWDYKIAKNWRPKNDEEWLWYLTRAINYGLNNDKLNFDMVKKYLPKLKIYPNKKNFLQFIVKNYEDHT